MTLDDILASLFPQGYNVVAECATAIPFDQCVDEADRTWLAQLGLALLHVPRP
jgi:hypothetical protein